MNLDLALQEAWQSTRSLHSLLASAPEVYSSEPDLAFIGKTLSTRFGELLGALDEIVGARTAVRASDAAAVVRFDGGEGMSMIRDLRRAAVLVRGGEVDWMVVRQGALAAQDRALADLSSIGIDEMRRVAKWLNTRLNESSPQALMSA